MAIQHGFVSISRKVKSAAPLSPHVLQTAAMFGLGVDESREATIVPPCNIPLPHLRSRSGIVLVTGPSGSGKSTVLNLIGEQCMQHAHAEVLRFDALTPLADQPLVDALSEAGADYKQTLGALSMAGLGDAFVMLRTPGELSEGQRYRLKLAQVMMEAQRTCERGTSRPLVVLADEFGSMLDRLTAQIIARNLRRWIDQQSHRAISFVAATAHDDVLEPLQPDVLVWKGLGEQVEVATRWR